ncbi:uncharacterized protein LOC134553972 isoform X1 [Prinia subflava]|uniref:uncharacterized protein LOC134553972 isoform X1 n=1 Tax=Prinia subflava TaxID=208062 RepID=UPI002FE3681F
MVMGATAPGGTGTCCCHRSRWHRDMLLPLLQVAQGHAAATLQVAQGHAAAQCPERCGSPRGCIPRGLRVQRRALAQWLQHRCTELSADSQTPPSDHGPRPGTYGHHSVTTNHQDIRTPLSAHGAWTMPRIHGSLPSAHGASITPEPRSTARDTRISAGQARTITQDPSSTARHPRTAVRDARTMTHGRSPGGPNLSGRPDPSGRSDRSGTVTTARPQ